MREFVGLWSRRVLALGWYALVIAAVVIIAVWLGVEGEAMLRKAAPSMAWFIPVLALGLVVVFALLVLQKMFAGKNGSGKKLFKNFSPRRIPALAVVALFSLFAYAATLIFAVEYVRLMCVQLADNLLLAIFEIVISLIAGWWLLPQYYALTSFVLAKSILKVPAVHGGIVFRFGARTPEVLEEGIVVVIPFVESVHIYQLDTRRKEITTDFLTKDPEGSSIEDQVGLIVVAQIEYVPDLYVAHPDGLRGGLSIYPETSDDLIDGGLSDRIKSMFAAMGGQRTLAEFRKYVKEVGYMIACLMRLPEPPHLNHHPGLREEPDPAHPGKVIKHPERCGIADCRFPPGAIDEKENGADGKPMLLEFYKTHWRRVEELLASEKFCPQDHSAVEMLYGIDVKGADLVNLDYHPDTKRAFDAKKLIALKAETMKKRREHIRELREMGATMQEATDQVNVALDERIIPRQISVQGGGGAIIVEQLASVFAGSGKRGEDEKKKDGKKKEKGGS